MYHLDCHCSISNVCFKILQQSCTNSGVNLYAGTQLLLLWLVMLLNLFEPFMQMARHDLNVRRKLRKCDNNILAGELKVDYTLSVFYVH